MTTTREQILAAGLRLFGEKGFEATGIREIAAAAGSNVASISYHFGGKDGLRAACAEHVVGLMSDVLASGPPDGLPAGPEAAQAMLTGMVRGLVRFLLLDASGRLVAGFMLREVARPSRALDIVYEGLFEKIHARACGLWAEAAGRTGEAESTAIRLAVFTCIGQILYFHVARPVVLRRMDWSGIGEREADDIAGTVVANLHARLAADRSERP